MEGCGCNHSGIGDRFCCHDNKVETLGLVASHRRNVKDGSQYDHFFPKANFEDKIINPNGTVKYTVQQMEKVVHDYHWQVAKLAKSLESNSLPQTLENIWQFFYDHYQYKLDKDGVEELRTPARAWHDGQILSRNPQTADDAGIDCDCYSISVSCVLTVLKIKHRLRVTKYSGGWQHVYVVIPVPGKPGFNWIIDCVLDKFNIEKTYSDKFDYTMDGLGIPVAILSGLNDADEMHSITLGSDFDQMGFAGDDELGDPEAELGALKRHLQRTRNFIARNPESVAFQGGAKANLEQLDFVLQHWDTPNQMKALNIAAKAEHERNVAMGFAAPGEFSELDGMDDEHSLSGLDDLSGTDDGMGADEDLGDVDTLGRAKKSAPKGSNKPEKTAPKKFIQNVRKAAGTIKKKAAVKAKKIADSKVVKKVAGAAKKTVKAVVRYNPVTAAARGGYLLVMKMGWFDLAWNLRPAYWTLEEAKAKGISEDRWNRSVSALNETRKIFVKVLQGKEENLKKAIIEGARRDGLSGELGFEPTTDAVVAASAAAPVTATAKAITSSGLKAKDGKNILQKIVDFFKINKDKIKQGATSDTSKKLFSKLKDRRAKKKAAKKAKKTLPDGSVENEDGSVTLPDGSVKEPDGTVNPASDYEGNSPDGSDDGAAEGGSPQGRGGKSSDDGDSTSNDIADKIDQTANAIQKMSNSSDDETTNGGSSNSSDSSGQKSAPAPTDGGGDSEGFLAKAKNFIKENPGKTAVGAVVVVGATLLAIPKTRKAILSPFSKKKGLSGPGKTKRKKKSSKRRVISPNTPYNKRKVRYVKM